MLSKHQPWNPPSASCQALPEIEWNMWRARQWPYSVLQPDDLILTVSGGGPKQGRVMCEVVVTDLIKGSYASKRDAWTLLQAQMPEDVLAAFGVNETAFMRHSHTVAGPESGFLLAWCSVPITIVDAPRPEQLRFRPDGWAELPDDEIAYLFDNAIDVPELGDDEQ